MVRPLIAILLLSVYTCTGTAFRQLQQAPVLVEHFWEHKILDKEINIFQFLVRRYLNGNDKDADYTRNQQLLLKGTGFVVSPTTGFFYAGILPGLKLYPFGCYSGLFPGPKRASGPSNFFPQSGNRLKAADVSFSVFPWAYPGSGSR